MAEMRNFLILFHNINKPLQPPARTRLFGAPYPARSEYKEFLGAEPADPSGAPNCRLRSGKPCGKISRQKYDLA
jgi:hypothetical protein